MSPLLTRRHKTHGDFAEKAHFIQLLKAHFRICPRWDVLTPAQKESLDLIATKIGRILYGDPNHKDSWLDVGGYAELIWRDLPE